MAITTVVPTITTADMADYSKTMASYAQFAKRIHLDLSDGTLTESILLNESKIEQLPQGLTIDVHYMTAVPSQHIDALIKLKPNLVLLHAEASEDLMPIFDKLHTSDIKTGVVILKSVYPGNIKNILTHCDHALIFSGTLGKQGGTAELLLLEKVALIRDINPKIEIGWDGGANLENTHILTHSGVDIINVGSAIAKAEDPAETYKQLMKATEKEEAI